MANCQTLLSVYIVCSAEYGGLGLDFSYSVAVAEELGAIKCGGIPMAIGVQSDMATPALARYSPKILLSCILSMYCHKV